MAQRAHCDPGRERADLRGLCELRRRLGLAELGRCDEALPFLERREQLLGPHSDVTEARSLCENAQ